MDRGGGELADNSDAVGFTLESLLKVPGGESGDIREPIVRSIVRLGHIEHRIFNGVGRDTLRRKKQTVLFTYHKQ